MRSTSGYASFFLHIASLKLLIRVNSFFPEFFSFVDWQGIMANFVKPFFFAARKHHPNWVDSTCGVKYKKNINQSINQSINQALSIPPQGASKICHFIMFSRKIK